VGHLPPVIPGHDLATERERNSEEGGKPGRLAAFFFPGLSEDTNQMTVFFRRLLASMVA